MTEPTSTSPPAQSAVSVATDPASAAPTRGSRRKKRWGLLALAGIALAVAASFFGMRFGYEHARYELVEEREAFEIRRYQPRIVAEVTVTAANGEAASNKGFRLLADYIFGNNIAAQKVAMTTPVDAERAGSEPIAMTTPVDVERADSETITMTTPVDVERADSEKIAMTTPVDVERTDSETIAMTTPVDVERTDSEKIAMTTPVDRSGGDGRWTVRFTMPSEYTLQSLPRPRDPRIQLRAQPAAVFAAIRFSGSPAEAVVRRRMAKLSSAVIDAGLTAVPGRSPLYARYDPPWTPGVLKRNEILIELVPTS